MTSFVPSEIYRKLNAIASLNPLLDLNSASRLQMYTANLGQKLVVHGMTERYLQTGMEQEFGKYTFSVKMPCDAFIIAVIPKYMPSMGADNIVHNPSNIVIFENVHTKEVDYLELTGHKSYHTHFGFPYKEQPGLAFVKKGNQIDKDTILLDSPGITPSGNYMYGVETHVAFMSLPGVSEDGVIMSESAIQKFKFNTYETKVIEWGRKRFPLNLYGDEKNYKIFPDIGDSIREDSLLMALRNYDTDMSPVRQSVEDCMCVNQLFDKRIYAEGVNGRVIDIKVITSGDKRGEPTVMDRQLQKYIIETKRYYEDIMEQYHRLKKHRGNGLQMSPAFHKLIVECLTNLEEEKTRISKIYRRMPLDDYRVEFTIEYEITPRSGFKFTTLDGGKGIVVQIMKDEDMPVDDFGNRAEYIMDPYSRINRMNLGGPAEMYINSASRDVGKVIRAQLGIERGDTRSEKKVREIYNQRAELFHQCWEYLVGYWKLIAPKMYEWASNGTMTEEEKIMEISTICRDHVYLYVPPESAPEYHKAIAEIEKSPYQPQISQVEYTGYSGKRVRTKQKVRIASMYIIMLEKIGDDNSTVASGKYQHFGVLAKLTREDRYSEPYRAQPVKGISETETRIIISYGGSYVMAEMMDRNNSPATHAEIVRQILRAAKPSDIPVVVDRQKIPYGSSKPIQIVNHIAQCAGWQFSYKNKPKPPPYFPLEDKGA